MIALLLATTAAAGEPGIPVTVRVLDLEGAPVASAVVRHRDEKDRHRVNAETGEWTNRVLYMPDGREVFIEKGMTLEFEVSAPGYRTERVVYDVRRRRNVFEVPLARLTIAPSDDRAEDVEIEMPRPKALDK